MEFYKFNQILNESKSNENFNKIIEKGKKLGDWLMQSYFLYDGDVWMLQNGKAINKGPIEKFKRNANKDLLKNLKMKDLNENFSETYAWQNDMGSPLSDITWRKKLDELRRMSTEGLQAAEWATAYVWHGPGGPEKFGSELARKYYYALEKVTSKLEEFAAAMKEFDDIED